MAKRSAILYLALLAIAAVAVSANVLSVNQPMCVFSEVSRQECEKTGMTDGVASFSAFLLALSLSSAVLSAACWSAMVSSSHAFVLPLLFIASTFSSLLRSPIFFPHPLFLSQASPQAPNAMTTDAAGPSMLQTTCPSVSERVCRLLRSTARFACFYARIPAFRVSACCCSTYTFNSLSLG